jgi:DNA-binding NarL/FixJ family response regulator
MRNLPLKAIVADDHRLFRQGLISLLNTRRNLVTVVDEAETGCEAIALAKQHQPDVVLMDIFMPDCDGLEAALTIQQALDDIAIIILTASEQNGHIQKALQLGAAGYLLKSLDATELFDLLNAVAHGEPVLTRAMASRLLKHTTNQDSALELPTCEDLTHREIDVLRLVVKGHSNPQIAETLCITENTVKVHLRNILAKLCVENRTQAAAYAIQSGIVDQIPPE